MLGLLFNNICMLKLIITIFSTEISIIVHILNANVQFFMKHERIDRKNFHILATY